MRLLIAAVLFVAGCKVNDYCLECLSGDGGHGDGGGGGAANDGGITGDGSGSGSACVPTNGGVGPGGGGAGPPGATNAGECRKGTNHCVNGALQCQGYVGPTPEVCDTLDNDCNGMIDDGLTNMGSCGSNSTSPCQLGVYQCQGGAKQCVGAINPTFEACDGIDNDCNGIIDDGYNKQSDPNTCGNTCAVCQVTANSNANPTCTGGVCGFACKPGYQDKAGNPAHGCEFGPCFPTGAEVSDAPDNDCDG